MEQAQERKWTARRLLIGAGIGCGGLIVLLFVVAFSVGYYFYMPGDQISTTRILGSDSTAIFRLENLGQDGGVTAVLETLMEELHRMDRERKKDLPGFARFLADMQKGRSKSDLQGMKNFLPREVTVTLENVPGQEDPEPVVAVNLSRFPRLIRFVLWMSRDERDTGPDSTDLDFVESTLLVARRPVLAQVVQRMKNPTEADSPDPELLEAYRSVDPRWDFHGVVLNRNNILGRTWGSSTEEVEEAPPGERLEDSFKDVRKLTYGVDIVSADEAEGEVVLDCLNKEKAVELLQQLAADLQSALVDRGLDATSSIERNENLVTLRLKARNLREALISGMRSSMEVHPDQEGPAEEETPDR